MTTPTGEPRPDPTTRPTTVPTSGPSAGPARGPETKSIKDIEASLIVRAWQDDAFRQRLVADPNAVLEEELNRNGLQKGKGNLKVLEETPDEYYLVLPLRPELLMTDEQVEEMYSSGIYQCPCNLTVSLGHTRSIDPPCNPGTLSLSRHCPGGSVDDEGGGDATVETE